ncbi:Elongation factor methyltransferase 5 [Hyphodiscus hymeniophilus]|uniref:Elongation factor methyltransferase 5 n=1 Tax=Hyphodiscus hymeniophilus TaxID=353542 RepID=A0A9P7AV92_9HELO|nr:Elongation factor methyltransferase 5 [Hyphodiscus hymeniophilus]
MEQDSDDENPVLSGSALDALREFYVDRDARLKQFEDLKKGAEENAAGQILSMDAFAEDWNESQFWYSEQTATILAKELLQGTTKDSVVAVVSAPSVFVALKNEMARSGLAKEELPKVWLLEFDRRFEVFTEFVWYDFNEPCKLPPAMTVRWLSKSWGTTNEDNKVIVCTGERMETLITSLYRPQGVLTTTFEPIHSKGLSNEFFCYANFECEEWKWKSSS